MKISLKKNRVANNAAWLIGTKIIQSVISLIIGMMSARYLGPSNYGLINYASSLVAFVLPIMQLGITNILVQEIVNNRENEGTILGTSLLLNLLSAIVCIIGVNTFCIITNTGDHDAIVVCFLYSIILVFQAIELVGYWFQAHLLSKYSSSVALFAYIISAAYKLFLLITQKSIFWFAVINTIEVAIISILQIIIYIHKKGQKFHFSFDVAKRLLKSGRYFIVSNMMITIFAQTDKIMLKQMLTNEAVGYYSAAIVCSTVTSFVYAAIIDSFRPGIFEAKKNGDESNYRDKLQLLYSIIIYVSLAYCVVITILAKHVVLLLYGDKYYMTVNPLRIVVWYTTFSYLGSVRNIWIISENKQKYLWIINLSGAVLNVFANAALIPIIGINGAALASLLTQFFSNVILGWIIPAIRDNNRIMISGLNPRNFRYLYNILQKK